MKSVAIPAKFLNMDGTVRSNLSEAEQNELNTMFGTQPLTSEDIAEIQANEEEYAGQHKERLEQYAAALRYRLVQEGFDLNGVRILCDDRTTLYLTALRMKAVGNPNFSVNWKTPNGFILLDAATIITASDMALQYVQSLFDAEQVLISQIDTGSVTSIEQIDEAFESVQSN